MENTHEFSLVKEELTHRIGAISKELNQPFTKAKGLKKLTELRDKLSKAKNFNDEVFNTLNKILEERCITFQEGEKDAFMEYIKPTIIELNKKYIKS